DIRFLAAAKAVARILPIELVIARLDRIRASGPGFLHAVLEVDDVPIVIQVTQQTLEDGGFSAVGGLSGRPLVGQGAPCTVPHGAAMTHIDLEPERNAL